MGATYRPGIVVHNRRSYHQWWSMGVTLIVDGPALAAVLSGAHLPASEEWKAGLGRRCDGVGRSVGMTSTGNRVRVARMVTQWFTHRLFSFSRYWSFGLDFFVMYRNGLIKKIKLISNFMTSQPQQLTRYLRLTLVFMWNGTQREKFSFCFSRVFC